jgi:hypothetical protein
MNIELLPKPDAKPASISPVTKSRQAAAAPSPVVVSAGLGEKGPDGAEASSVPATVGQPEPKNLSTGKAVNVRGYYRKDGAYVAPYTRSAPGGKK